MKERKKEGNNAIFFLKNQTVNRRPPLVVTNLIMREIVILKHEVLTVGCAQKKRTLLRLQRCLFATYSRMLIDKYARFK